MLRPLDDELRWAILHAPADESANRLARRLKRTFPAVYAFRRKVREHGWVCRIAYHACPICGETMVVSVDQAGPTRQMHRACQNEARRQRDRQRRATDPGYRERRLMYNLERHRTLAAASAGLNTRRKQRWTEEERRYLLEHRHELRTSEGVERVARRLGRSYSACCAMLVRMDREQRHRASAEGFQD